MVKLGTAVAAGATLVLGGATAAGATPSATSADDGWHKVHEAWQPYVEGTLTLPADRYCGDFDLELSAQEQDIVSKVTTRWDTGGERTVAYKGPLLTRATNLSTGESVVIDLGGKAGALYRADGSLQTYSLNGPVGVGWPQDGGGLSRGYYLMDGKHVIDYAPDGTRTLTEDKGSETDVCRLVR
ncbi:hypothetical protein [Phycicoccus elongatus]|nr:hypothetical protein [Phycicoccus elongatus]